MYSDLVQDFLGYLGFQSFRSDGTPVCISGQAIEAVIVDLLADSEHKYMISQYYKKLRASDDVNDTSIASYIHCAYKKAADIQEKREYKWRKSMGLYRQMAADLGALREDLISLYQSIHLDGPEFGRAVLFETLDADLRPYVGRGIELIFSDRPQSDYSRMQERDVAENLLLTFNNVAIENHPVFKPWLRDVPRRANLDLVPTDPRIKTRPMTEWFLFIETWRQQKENDLAQIDNHMSLETLSRCVRNVSNGFYDTLMDFRSQIRDVRYLLHASPDVYFDQGHDRHLDATIVNNMAARILPARLPALKNL